MLKFLNKYALAIRRLTPSSSGRNSNNMAARAVVRNVENEERIQISFKYPPLESNDTTSNSIKQRVFNFDRLKTEELEKTYRVQALNLYKTDAGAESKDTGDFIQSQLVIHTPHASTPNVPEASTVALYGFGLLVLGGGGLIRRRHSQTVTTSLSLS